MSEINNGGATGYYDLPLPDKEALLAILMQCRYEELSYDEAIEAILSLCPQTLNDLIESQEMQPWQHEIFKATYALNARALKNGGSKLREINKIIYYAERGKRLVEKEFNKVEAVEEFRSYKDKVDKAILEVDKPPKHVFPTETFPKSTFYNSIPTTHITLASLQALNCAEGAKDADK